MCKLPIMILAIALMIKEFVLLVDEAQILIGAKLIGVNLYGC